MWRVIIVQHHRDTVCDVSIFVEAISFSWLRRSWACTLLSWCKLAHILESDEWMHCSNNRNWRNLVSLATNVAMLVYCCFFPNRHIVSIQRFVIQILLSLQSVDDSVQACAAALVITVYAICWTTWNDINISWIKMRMMQNWYNGVKGGDSPVKELMSWQCEVTVVSLNLSRVVEFGWAELSFNVKIPNFRN